MKQLTMTKVLTPLAALAFAFGVQAANPGAPDGFETQTDAVVTNRTGWSFTYGSDGADDASSINTHASASVEAPTGTLLPDAFATAGAGSNYLKLSTEDGTLFRNMDGANGATVDLNAGLFVDTDVQFTVTDPSDSPTNSVNNADKLVIWLEDQGAAGTNLCVLGHQFGATASARSDKVYTLSGPVAIVPGNWYRLTVKAIASTSVSGESFSYPAFQVFVNGEAFSANENIAEAENQTALGILSFTAFQPYIPARAETMSALSQVGFSGEGAVDNLVVTKDVPGFEDPTTLTFNFDTSVISSIEIDDLGATLTASGSKVVTYPNQTFNITLNFVNDDADSYTVTTSVGANQGEYASVSGLAVSTLAAGAATITVTTTAKDTVNVTFNWAALNSAMGERAIENTAITFAYGETVYNAVIDGDNPEESHTFENLKVGTNITVTVSYSTADWVTSYASTTPGTAVLSRNSNVFTITSRGDGNATISISADEAAASVGGQSYTTFAAALANANGATIKLLKGLTVSEAVTIANGTSAVIDLAGKNVTGASGAATVFTVDAGGSLTITNSTEDVGIVSKGSATVCISNAGTLNLQAGKFDIADGAISGGTINVSGGAYNSGTFTGATLPPGKALAENTGAVDAYAYELANAVYTVTYYDGSNAPIVALATNYTYGTGLATLASGPEVAGKTFDGWYASSERTGDAVTSIGAAETEDKEFFAKYSDNTYTIKFVYGLNGETTNTQSSVAYNTMPTVPTSEADVTGYTWDWNTTPVAVTGDATYTAVYTAINYSISYYNADGTAFTEWKSGYDAPTTFTVASAVTLPGSDNVALSSGTFNNWTNATGTVSSTAGLTANLVVYANVTEASGWVDPADVPADKTAAEQYPSLAGTALASANAKKLTKWADDNSIDFSAVESSASTYVEAFLLNCSTSDVAAEKAAFKLDITVGADGSITVTLPDGKVYNGNLQMKGSNDLSTWTNTGTTTGYKFFKYELGL